jgi:Rieske 2Fe-2S family protein
MHTLMLDDKKMDRVQQHMLDKMPACGLKELYYDFTDTEAPPGQQGYSYSRTAMFESYKTGSRDGEPVAPLLGNLTGYDGGASDFTIGPVSFFLAYSDHVVGYVFTPVDQNNCKCEIYWMVRGDAVEGKDYNVDDLMWLWDVTTYADDDTTSRVRFPGWRGLRNGGSIGFCTNSGGHRVLHVRH